MPRDCRDLNILEFFTKQLHGNTSGNLIINSNNCLNFLNLFPIFFFFFYLFFYLVMQISDLLFPFPILHLSWSFTSFSLYLISFLSFSPIPAFLPSSLSLYIPLCFLLFFLTSFIHLLSPSLFSLSPLLHFLTFSFFPLPLSPPLPTPPPPIPGIDSRIAKVLNDVQLEAPYDRIIKSFSGGQQARLLLAAG